MIRFVYISIAMIDIYDVYAMVWIAGVTFSFELQSNISYRTGIGVPVCMFWLIYLWATHISLPILVSFTDYDSIEFVYTTYIYTDIYIPVCIYIYTIRSKICKRNFPIRKWNYCNIIHDVDRSRHRIFVYPINIYQLNIW